MTKTFIGDWGLGIGDWAQSPIPNPQTILKYNSVYEFCEYFIKLFNINNYMTY
jgi:hypothetical protein